MKIALVSPSPQHLRDMAALLQGRSHTVTSFEGGKSRMRDVAESEAPDVMVVDGMCCDPAELAHAEWVTTHHPGIALLLLCAVQSPEFLIQSMRAGVREVLPSPAPAEALLAAMDRIVAKRAGARGLRQGKVVAFIPAKGGSGATFLATNLGWQLAESRSVLLVDLNLQFGDALSFVHDGRAASTIADVARDITRLDASLLSASAVKVAPNFSVLASPEEVAQAMEVKPEHIDAILGIAVGHYDFVLLDLGRNLDPFTIKALDRADRIYVVLQSGVQQVRNTSRLLEVFRSLGYGPDKAELIVNRFEKSGDIGIEQIRKAVGGVRIHTVANDWREVNAAVNHGDALVKGSRSSAVARQINALCAALHPRQEDNRGLLRRMFRRA